MASSHADTHKHQRKPFFNTIVVGADFSNRSRRVFKNALSLARQWGTNVVLIHVANIEKYGVYYSFGELPERREKVILENKLRKFYNVPKSRKVKISVLFGDPVSDLIRAAKKFKHPLIMIGHTEKGALSRLTLGSVSKKLAMTSPVPVWIQ